MHERLFSDHLAVGQAMRPRVKGAALLAVYSYLALAEVTFPSAGFGAANVCVAWLNNLHI